MDVNQEKKRRLKEWQEKKYSLPLKAVLNITYRCNLNCLFCGDAVNRKNRKIDFKKELSDEEWIRLVKESLNLGVKEWWFPGIGEPLMRKELLMCLINIIKSSKDTYCKITSNGTLFDRSNIKNLIKKEIDEVSLSLDSTNFKIHDFLRGKDGTFQRLISTAQEFKKLKQRYKKELPVISLNFVLTQKNFSEFKDLINLAKELNIKKISINPLRIDSGNYNLITKEKLRLTKDKMKEIKKEIPKIKDYAKIKKIQFDINSIKELEIIHDLKEEKKTFQGYNQKKEINQKIINASCHEPWYCFAIDPFGNITPCTSAGNENKIANVKKHLIKDIWIGKEFQNIRKSLLQNKPLKVCSKCLASLVRIHAKKIAQS